MYLANTLEILKIYFLFFVNSYVYLYIWPFLRRAQLVALFSPHIRVYWKLRKSIYPGKFFWFLILFLFLRKMSRSHPSNLPIFPISEFHGIISSINLFQKLRFRLSGNLDSRFDQIKSRLSLSYIGQIEYWPLRHGHFYVCLQIKRSLPCFS